MDIRPLDRRGLGETVAWASALGVVGLLLLVDLIKTGSMDPILLGGLSGLLAALLGRGTQSANERSAREETARALEDAARAAVRRAEDAARRAEDATSTKEGNK